MSQQGQQNATDQTASFFWYIVLLTVACILAWVFGKQYLVPPLFYLREAQLYLLEIAFKIWNFFAHVLALPDVNLKPYNNMFHFMLYTSPDKVTSEQVGFINKTLGSFYRYPFCLILLTLAGVSAFRHRSARFVNSYSMKSLCSNEVENWPQISPVVSKDLLANKLDQGPWAMSKLPLDFCRENNLLKVVKRQEKQCWSITHGAAERVFVLQMGPLWESVDALPIHIKALVVIAISRINGEKEVSLDLLAQIAKSAGSGRLDFSNVNTLVEKYKKHKVFEWALARHAYVYTVMATLLEIARTEGVLASAEFVWLKPLDRRLWYVLNTVGRATPFVEVAGVYAHWLAEKKLQKALCTPVVNEAVKALDIAVGEILYVAEGEKWHINNAA